MESQGQADIGFLDKLRSRYSAEMMRLDVKVATAKSRMPHIPDKKGGILTGDTLIPAWSQVIIGILALVLSIMSLIPISVPISIPPIVRLIISVIVLFVLVLFVLSFVYALYELCGFAIRDKILRLIADRREIEIRELQKKIKDLSLAIERITEGQEKIRLSVQATSPEKGAQEECDHLRKLLDIHVRVIRELELQAAALGSEFHYSKKIELEERQLRVADLKQRIAQNC